MATTKRKGTTKSRRATSARRDVDLPTRTARTIKNQPYVSAAIATGAVTAVVAAVAGAFFFRRNQEAIGEFTEEVSAKIKGGVSEARSKASDGLRSFKEKAAFLFDDEDRDDHPSQSEIMEEALSVKQVAPTGSRPVVPVLKNQTKAGAVAY